VSVISAGAAPPTDAALAEVALSRAEYEAAARLLGREPNHVELGILGALWSEHCSYKTSKPLLRALPTTGAAVLQGPGENAGAVDVGDGFACVFKIESHNHPSAIEPYQGAATGVGGILRDIFTMGARPVALLDSLRFGPLEEPRQRHLFEGVVAGIGGYGNCIGVPTVGGELYFDESYRENCIVNAMCVGVVPSERLTRASARGPGNAVLLVGADTGRDGIHGASFASVQFDDSSEERRPAVQVGNPFLEKCLMEACLELAGDPRIVAMQDLGAAGLCGSAAELAHRGGVGVEIDVARVARREQGMTPYEVMLSESQERMLVVVRPQDVDAVQQVFERWDLHSDVVGRVVAEQRFVVRDGGAAVCDLPLDVLVDGVPQRTAPGPRPERAMTLEHRMWASPWPMEETLLRLLRSPNLGSRRAVFRTYDHQVGDATVVRPGGDAAVVRIPGSVRGLAMCTDGNARYTSLAPRRGAAIAVCEAARNVVATGARPVALTNCLNFGNPEVNDVYWDLHDAIAGIADACTALGVPVVSGNVSLYNESERSRIAPTVVIGMVGVIDDVARHCAAAFASEGDEIAVAGPLAGRLDASELQRLGFGVNAKVAPDLDLDLERRVQSFVGEAIAAGLLHSAHDLAEGGLGVAAAECAIWSGLGLRAEIAELTHPPDGERAPFEAAGILFGEGQSRFLISYAREALVQLQDLAARHSVPLRALGTVGGSRITFSGVLDVSLEAARDAYEEALQPSA